MDEFMSLLPLMPVDTEDDREELSQTIGELYEDTLDDISTTCELLKAELDLDWADIEDSLAEDDDDADDQAPCAQKLLPPEGFVAMIERLRRERNMTKAELAEAANMTPDAYSRLTGPKQQTPSRDSLYALGLACHLDYQGMNALLNTEGYCFPKPCERDAIIMDCMKEQVYSIDAINGQLDAAGQKMLGKYEV
jgi:transcriptional regulator with XRE-family HTH domain